MGEVIPVRQGSMMAYSPKQLELVKKTVAKDCNNDEFNYFVEVAKFRGLNPLLKQIYAFVFNKDDEKKRQLTIVTSIDGYRLIASRCRDYRPDEDEPKHVYDETLKSSENPRGLVKSVVYCFKLGPDNAWHRVAGEAYWDEFAPIVEEADAYDWVDSGEVWADSGKPKKKKVPRGDVRRVPKEKWATMPHVMLAKCAEAQALRRGWPEDFYGVYVAEEIDRARTADLTASELVEQHKIDERMQLVGSKNSIFVQWAPETPLEPVPLGQFADRAAAFVRQCTTLPDLVGWADTNRAALQDFWAKSKSDALELKKVIEARQSEIAEANKTT